VPLLIFRDEKAARAAEKVRVQLAALADGRGVDDRHDLVDVVDRDPVVKRLVAVEQGEHVHVLLEFGDALRTLAMTRVA